MWSLLDNKDCLEYVLQVVLDNNELKIECYDLLHWVNVPNESIKGTEALFSTGTDEWSFVELFQSNSDITPQEVRYLCAQVEQPKIELFDDLNAAKQLPVTYVIFLVNGDPFGAGLPVYHVSNKVLETDNDFRDNLHIIYIDSSNRDNTALGQLMHDLHCTNVEEMYDSTFAKIVEKIKIWL